MSDPFNNLREAHVHLCEHGQDLSTLDLTHCVSTVQCLELIAHEARGKGADQWVVASRARVQGWSDPVWPTARQLHDAADGRPCIVKSFDIHSLVASDRALAAAGIAPDQPLPTDIPSGLIECDEYDRPTGLVLETMAQRVLDAAPTPTPDQRRQWVRLACKDLSRRGFVEAHDMLSRPWLGSILADLFDAGELPLRILLHPVREDFDHALADRSAFERDTIALGGLKVFTDGTLNSKTAWMLEPYADPRPEAPCGRQTMSDEAFVEALARAEAAHLPIVAHAIGDAAVRRRLDLIESHGVRNAGHRIEHCEFIDEKDIPRFAQLGVIASMQPCHLLPDIEAIERLTPHRADRAMPLRELIDAAKQRGRDPAELIWLGSDAPVVEPNPMDNVQAAVERRRVGMPVPCAIAPEQAVSRDETLSLMKATKESDPS